MAVATAPAQKKNTAGADNHAAAAAVAGNPFTRASKRKTEVFMDVTSSLSAGGKSLAQVEVPATGFLRHLYLDVQVDAPAGATALAADAPWNVIESLTLKDVNGTPLHTVSGYDLFLANLLGGYVGIQGCDPRLQPGYTATFGGGIRFALRVPVEIIGRGAMGSLANTNSGMTYKLSISLAPRGNVFTGATADPNVRIRGVVESWSIPAAADLRGTPNVQNPPYLGTTQNWSEQVAPLVVGQNTTRLSRVGNAIRNLVLIRRDATGARVDSWPDTLSILFDGNQWHQAPVDYFKRRQTELYGKDINIPAGVLVFPFTDDFDGTPGEEVGDYWLQTSGATRFEIQGTYPSAGSLTILTNDVIAVAGPAGAGATLGAQA